MYEGNPGKSILVRVSKGLSCCESTVFTIGIPKAWSGLRSGVSTGDMLILWTFKINSNDDTADYHRSRIQGIRKASIHQSGVCSCSPVGHMPHLEALMLQNIFFSLVKTASEIILSIQCEIFNQGHHFNFWSSWDWELLLTQKAQIQDGRNNNTLNRNIFRVYTHSQEDILISIFCTSLVT